jgi:hypothetical protein
VQPQEGPDTRTRIFGNLQRIRRQRIASVISASRGLVAGATLAKLTEADAMARSAHVRAALGRVFKGLASTGILLQDKPVILAQVSCQDWKNSLGRGRVRLCADN